MSFRRQRSSPAHDRSNLTPYQSSDILEQQPIHDRRDLPLPGALQPVVDTVVHQLGEELPPLLNILRHPFVDPIQDKGNTEHDGRTENGCVPLLSSLYHC